MKRTILLAPPLLLAFFLPASLAADSVPVRYREGVVRGFLALRSTDGKLLASGDLIQFPRGDRVVSRFVLRFPDGSLHEETAVFTQRDRFRLVSDHLVQRGRTFPNPIELKIDAAKGRVNVKRRDDDGKDEVVDEDMELPADLANGMVLTLLKNVSPQTASTTVSMLFATPKPRLVKLVITPRGQEPFSVGRASYKATRYKVEVEIGGLAGLVAGLLGKKPPDTSVWIVGGDAPGFVRSEGPMYQDGPIWRIELAAPDYGRGRQP